jgi:hypothetical protein
MALVNPSPVELATLGPHVHRKPPASIPVKEEAVKEEAEITG